MGKGDWIRRPDDQEKYDKNFEEVFGEGPSNLWDPKDPDHPQNCDGAGGQSGEETSPVSEHDRILRRERDTEAEDYHSEDKESHS